MRINARIGIFALLCCLIIPSGLWAMNWDINPGLYLDYEYTDNYYGVSENPVSESTYHIGPSLGILATDQNFIWSLTGYLSREYHKRNHEERDTESRLETSLSTTRARHGLNLDYSYAQTRSRESLDAPWGEHHIHTGNASWNVRLTPHNSLTLGYTKNIDTVKTGGTEDRDSDGGNATWSSQLTPHNSIEISGTYETIHFEPSAEAPAGYVISEDMSTYNTSLRWRHTATPNLGIGTLFSYGKDTPEESEWLKTYGTSVFVDYTFTSQLVGSLSGGHSWLKSETQETNESTTADASLTYSAERDTFSLGVSHDYTHEYTTGDTYGIYKTISARAMLEHSLSRAWMLSLTSDYTKREPTSSDIEPDETTMTHGASMRYHLGPDLLRRSSMYSRQQTSAASSPIAQEEENDENGLLGNFPSLGWRSSSSFDVLFSYTHLQRDIQDSEIIRENRYSISIEVRY